MKKQFITLLLIALSSFAFAQKENTSDNELKAQLDSVLIEGKLLYQYEKAAWIATDLAMQSTAIKKEYAGYFTYEDDGNMKTIILGKENQTCIAEYIFSDNFNKPTAITEQRKLTEKERELILVRENFIKSISSEEYNITVPQGFSLNLILVPFAEKYKLYIIAGTSQHNVIPFGNDFIFIGNKNGEIESWQKYHSRLIADKTEINGNKAVELVHSHLKSTPLITPTDICTFMLYAPLYKIDYFSVYSTALGKYFKYSLKDHTITVKKA